ncbi:hypothetical protein GCM10020000_53100 [Streptomyces olivoverticillatus]
MTLTVENAVAGHPDGTAAAKLLHELLDTTAALRPQHVAVRDSKGSWTWQDLVAQSHAAAAWLRAQGVRPGDRVVVRLPNVRETVAMLYAASRCGAALVPISAEMKDFHLKAVIANCEPRLVVVVDGAGDKVRPLTGFPVHEIGTVWGELTDGASVPAEAHDPASPAVLIYTSGSTATPPRASSAPPRANVVRRRRHQPGARLPQRRRRLRARPALLRLRPLPGTAVLPG